VQYQFSWIGTKDKEEVGMEAVVALVAKGITGKLSTDRFSA